MTVLSSGRRCPNAAIAGSTYCGLPQHQALSRFTTSHVAVLSGLGDSEIETLANPDSDEAEVTAIVTGAEAGFVEPSEEAEVEAEVDEAEAEAEVEAEVEEVEVLAETAGEEPEVAAEAAQAEVEVEVEVVEAEAEVDAAVEAAEADVDGEAATE